MNLRPLQVGPTPPAFAELLREADRLLKKIEARTAQPVRPTGGVKKVAKVLYDSTVLVRNYANRAEGLRYQIRDLTFVLYGVPEEKPDIAGAMARIEEHIDDLLLQRRKILRWRTDPPGREGRALLAAMYDHILGEVRTWLETTIETLGNPLKALPERGEYVAPGVVKLVVPSHFGLPPAFDDLEVWAEHCLGTSKGGRRP